jgi:hypothetical protein
MHFIQRAGQCGLIFAAIILAACAGQKEPAQKLIDDIESTVAAAAPEAAKYVPGQLADVQSQLDTLKASFDKKDYASVVTGAPAVLGAAQGLATAAAAKKDEVLKALNDKWTRLAAALPENLTAIQNRIDLLGKKANRKMAAGIDLDAAKAGLSDAAALWSRAQGAFASGNLDEAVSTASGVRAKIDALATSLKLDLAAMAASPAA